MVICQCSVSEIGPLWFYVLFCGESLLAKKEVAAHTRLTEMTRKAVLSYSGYELVLQEQGAEPRDLEASGTS